MLLKLLLATEINFCQPDLMQSSSPCIDASTQSSMWLCPLLPYILDKQSLYELPIGFKALHLTNK